jgi:hypothetical protein
MKNLVQWNEALRDGLRLKDQEAADVDKLPRTLATATSNASTPARRPDTNADKQALDTDQQQVQTVQQQQEQIKTMPDTYIQRVATADESPVMQLLREMQQQFRNIQQQLQDIQQQQLDMQATLQHQTQQHQSFQEKMLKRQELEHLQAARVQDQERSRDLLAIGTAVEKAFGERASGLQERSQQITMREKELKRI